VRELGREDRRMQSIQPAVHSFDCVLALAAVPRVEL
jgi:hypothetical protein